jgi:hypothetical protein
LAAVRAPLESIAENCSIIAVNWTKLLGNDDELIESCVPTPARLIERVRETGSLENLGTELELERTETVAWLNRLIAAVAEAERPACLDGLIPDQTPEGAFRSGAELSRDTDIDDELKDVLETLDDPIRKRLVHEDIVGAETIVKRVQPRDRLVSSAKDRLKNPNSKNTRSTPISKATVTAPLRWSKSENWPSSTLYSMRRCVAAANGRRDFFSSFSITWSMPTNRGSRREGALCECGKEHEIIPCEWLSFIRVREGCRG